MEIQEPTISNLSLMNHTHATGAQGGPLGVVQATSVNGLSFTTQSVGFTIAGGVTSKTLTVPLDASVSGTNTGDQTNITGNAATVTVADAGGDTTTWVLLGTSQTGSLTPASDAGLTYDATANNLTATTFTGALAGNATTATTATNATNVATTTKADNTNYFLPFVAANSSSNQAVDVGPMTANPSTSTITATNFAGNASTASTAAALSATLVPASGGTGVANNNASTLTISGNFGTTLTVSNTTSVTLPTSGTLATLAGTETLSDKQILVPSLPSDNVATGLTTTMVANENLSAWDVCKVGSDGRMKRAVATALVSSSAIGIATGTINSGNSGTFLLRGTFKANALTAWTPGALIYLHTSKGLMTMTAPTGTDQVTQILGVALGSKSIAFMPNLVQVTHV